MVQVLVLPFLWLHSSKITPTPFDAYQWTVRFLPHCSLFSDPVVDNYLFFLQVPFFLDRDTGVDIGIVYGLCDPGIECRRGRDFPWRQIGSGCQTSYTLYTGSVPRVRRPGHGVNHPPPSSAEINERVELYLPSWQVGDLYLYLYLKFFWSLRDAC